LDTVGNANNTGRKEVKKITMKAGESVTFINADGFKRPVHHIVSVQNDASGMPNGPI
jgi:hypothetical protein